MPVADPTTAEQKHPPLVTSEEESVHHPATGRLKAITHAAQSQLQE